MFICIIFHFIIIVYNFDAHNYILIKGVIVFWPQVSYVRCRTLTWWMLTSVNTLCTHVIFSCHEVPVVQSLNCMKLDHHTEEELDQWQLSTRVGEMHLRCVVANNVHCQWQAMYQLH